MLNGPKCDQLREVILTLADGAHRARINDLLSALEQEIGAATIRYAAGIVQARAESAHGMHSDAASCRVAEVALQQAARSVGLTDWEREKILGIRVNDHR